MTLILWLIILATIITLTYCIYEAIRTRQRLKRIRRDRVILEQLNRLLDKYNGH